MRSSDQTPSGRQAGICVAIGRLIPANYPLSFSEACCLVSSAIKSLRILDFFGFDDGNQGKLAYYSFIKNTLAVVSRLNVTF